MNLNLRGIFIKGNAKFVIKTYFENKGEDLPFHVQFVFRILPVIINVLKRKIISHFSVYIKITKYF